MRPIRTDSALLLCESEECVVTSSRAKSADANQNSQLASLIELCDLEQGGVVINMILHQRPYCQREVNNLLNRLLTKSGKSGYTHIALALLYPALEIRDKQLRAKVVPNIIGGRGAHVGVTRTFSRQGNE